MKVLYSLIILMLVFSTYNTSHCQPIYFNNLYHIGDPNTWSGANTLGMDEEGYVIWGKTGMNVGLVRLNFYGEQQWHKSWGDSIASWYAGWPGSMVSMNDEHYLAGSKNYYSPTNYDVGMVMKLNHNWDTIWTKEYSMNLDDNPDTSTLINQMAICNNGDLILVGNTSRPDIGSQTLLMRIDSAGVVLWIKTYIYSRHTMIDGYSVIQTTDNGFAIGGDWYMPGTYADGDPIIIKTDSMGNKEWIKNLGGWYEDYFAKLCLSADGNILMGTTIADTSIGHSPISRINVVKLDNHGNIIWNKKYGSSSLDNFLNNIRCLEDGNIICTGSVHKYPPWNSGWVLKLDSNGDSLWYRLYNYFVGDGSFNDLDDIIQTEDSGFFACGDLFPIPPDTGIQSAWGLKLDRFGCEWEGCDTTVGIEENWRPGDKGKVVNGDKGELGGLYLWPNPARTIVHYQLSTVDFQRDLVLVIYDIFGREVMKTSVIPKNRTVSLNVSNLSSGIYLVVCRDSGKNIYKGKFVVAR
jgi:hypothetical protein